MRRIGDALGVVLAVKDVAVVAGFRADADVEQSLSLS